MSDRRRWPCNGRVAARRLEGQAEALRFVAPERRSVGVPLADLLTGPGGRRDRQVVFGEALDLLEVRDGFAFVEALKDGYTGYVEESVLAGAVEPTHVVRAPSTHVYPERSIKVFERHWLTLGARVRVTAMDDSFAETPQGFIPRPHLAPVDAVERDPVAVAERLLGTPYLWGGNSRMGIDCSGLVQVACVACGIPCPGDSDMQERELGTALPADAALRRGDLVFWKGHVAWVVDADRILHANGHDMAVAYEGLGAAIARIEAQGEGLPTGRRRLG